MRAPDRRTAPIVQFSAGGVNKAKTLLQKGKTEPSEVVSIPGCSSASATRTHCAPNEPDLSPPSYLVDEIALRQWLVSAPALLRRGLLDETMKPLLAGYCNALARSVRAEQVLSKEGRYYKTTLRDGSTIKRRHPAVQDAEEGWASVRYFAKQLGISSPSPSLGSRETKDLSMFK